MNYEDYKAQRDELMAQAKAALDAGKVDEAKKARASIEELDTAYEAAQAEAANLAALETGVAKPAAPVAPQAIKAAVAGPVVAVAPAVDEGKAREEMYRTAFAKTLMKRTLTADESDIFAQVNHGAFATVANKASGNQVVIPTTMKQEIWQEMAELHPIIGEVDFTDVPGNLEIPKETGNSGDAAWVDEDTAATSGTLSLSNITLAGHELVKAITVSWKLKTMSIDAFLTYITTKIAERMGAAIANAIVSGKGIPGVGDTFKAQPYGIITRLKGETNTPQVVTYTHGGSVAYANITAALGKIKSGYMDGVKIYAKNSDIWNQLANITTTQKQPIFIPDPTGQTIGRLFGREVVEEDAIPTGSFLIGNVRRAYVMNRNQDVSIYTEEHTLARSTDYMGYAILDGDLLTTKAFVLIKEAAS
ncbi:putative phage major capsid protein [Selenomonas ruminantium subsp. lactilytica TAM6421]|uniref:Putative phage major capsid protein n=1 Tax=Selenomonas ruminantium subsp. lactilytica (strain NBRC 103574 / TAM6421) TaxID=927704 RepID=I0GQ00_SELRL|nr:phage major capsid protein [Selenomonas ruminantium]BAL82837.1 putative phage major capsid protein [Selenomonas ruminantium subsp. lactilytica TAM6421]